jgi:aspartate/methionine/tyrosine aminotransferase
LNAKPFLVERWFSKYEFNVDYNIAESCIEPLRLTDISELTGVDMLSYLGNQPVGYVQAEGSTDLREAVASMYPGAGVENVLITTGAIEANYLLHSSIVRPGDKVVCEFPAYQQLHEVARGAGAELRFWRLTRENGFSPDPAELEEITRDGVSIIVVNDPHNPTGSVLGDEQVAAVVGVAEHHGAILHSDEVYLGLDYGRERPSLFGRTGRVVVTGSTSKSWGLSGARVGWLVGPKDIIERCSELRDYTSICPSYLSERLAFLVLTHKDQFMRRSRELAQANRKIVAAWMEENAQYVEWIAPAAGVVCFPWQKTRLSSIELCARLAEEARVLLLPGECFETDRHFRLGFGYDTKRLISGLDRFGAFLDSL